MKTNLWAWQCQNWVFFHFSWDSFQMMVYNWRHSSVWIREVEWTNLKMQIYFMSALWNIILNAESEKLCIWKPIVTQWLCNGENLDMEPHVCYVDMIHKRSDNQTMNLYDMMMIRMVLLKVDRAKIEWIIGYFCDYDGCLFECQNRVIAMMNLWLLS